MTRPTPSASKVLLVANGRPSEASSAGAVVRRYRLARLRFDGRSEMPAARFDHLKRSFD